MKGKILISTGGSGGHVIPAITIHDHLKENYNILISTDVRGLKYLDDKSYETVVIDTPKLNNFILLFLVIIKMKNVSNFYSHSKINLLVSILNNFLKI